MESFYKYQKEGYDAFREGIYIQKLNVNYILIYLFFYLFTFIYVHSYRCLCSCIFIYVYIYIGLLHAKSALMESMPLNKKGGMVWVDVGGGTARNLEFFSVGKHDVTISYNHTLLAVPLC
jgi:hypothetical protein